MTTDLIYLAWNRLEFTAATFRLLLQNTNWERVNRLLVFEDGSIDGTREWLDQEIKQCPVPSHLSHLGWHSPVMTMLHYLGNDPAESFVKIDNDVAVPPGWLDELLACAEAHPEVMLLGMEAGQTTPNGAHTGPRSVTPSSWIGGIGLLRTAAFKHSRPKPRGRFGFTEWQETHTEVQRGWITPDLLVPQLDRIPVEPWATYARQYVARGWQRYWSPYDPDLHEWCYQWFLEATA